MNERRILASDFGVTQAGEVRTTAAALVKVQSGLLQSFSQHFRISPRKGGAPLLSSSPWHMWWSCSSAPEGQTYVLEHQLGAIPAHQQSQVAELKQEG